MAVTRIKNNQITDSTIIANAKIQNYTVTSSLLANNLTYGSDFTISGNLTVNGTTTTVDTVNTLIQDPLITLADGQTSGSPTVDIGTIGLRGSELSAVMAWKESDTSFVAALSNTTISNTTFNLNQYADFKANTITANSNLNVTGTTSLTGNITSPLNVTGNINGGNVYSTGVINSDGTITGGNISTGGFVSATGNIDGGNINTAGEVSSTGNISSQGRISATGNVHAGNVNVDAQVSAAGNITAGSGAYFLGDGSLLTGVAAASVNAANLVGNTLSSNVTFSSLTSVGDLTSLSVVGTAQVGNLQTAGAVSATGTVTGGNVETGGAISGTGNITGGNLFTGGAVSATGTVTGGNVETSGTVSATSTITGGNVATGGTVSATSTITGGNLATGGTVSATGTATVGNVETIGTISASGNITGGNLITDTWYGNTITVSATGTNGGINLVPNGTGNINVNSRYINNLPTPLQANDAANKDYVDAIASGLDLKASCYAATTAELDSLAMVTNVEYDNGTSGVGATLTITTSSQLIIDAVNLSSIGTGANARVLVKNEASVPTATSDNAWNGIYIVTSTGSGSTVLTRSVDFDDEGTTGALPGAFTFIADGTVNADTGWVCTTNNPITMGTTPITFAQFSGAGAYTAGNALSLNGSQFNVNTDSTGNATIGVNGSNELYIPTGAILSQPNIGQATGTSLSLAGTVTAGNVSTAGYVSATGDVTGGNVYTGGEVSATGNITGGNISTSGSSGNITGANVIASTSMTATGTITGGNLATGGTVSATGNITGGNVATGGEISGTGNITGGNILTGGLISATGNVTAANFFGNISGNVDAGGSNTQIQFNNDNIIDGSAGFTFDYTSNLVTMSGNLNVANIFTPGSIQANGNVYGDNFIALSNIEGDNISVLGNVLGTTVSITGNVIASNVNAVGGNLEIGNVNASFTVTGANVVGGNLYMTGDELSGTNGIVSVNSSLNDVDFAVSGDTVANIFYVDAASGTVSFGSEIQVACAIMAMNATTSFVIPAGNLTQRPSSTTTGMLRFNTTNNTVEVFNNSEWTDVGATQFTLIQDEQFNGDGSTVEFTLDGTYTTQSCIVAINGVVQIPTSAYSVSGTDPTCVLTFTEAPEAGDLIDVRELTTTSTVSKVSNSTETAVVEPNSTLAEVDITGNLVPVANAVYSLGDATHRWSSLHVAGNTIYLGSLQLKEASANTFAVYTADGTTEANIAVGNIDVTSIQSGTSSIAISAPNGNAVLNAGGNNTVIATPTGANITGYATASGTITGGNLATGGTVSAAGNITGNYILGNGSQLTGIDATSIQNGTSSVAVIASGGNVRANVGGATITTTYASGLAVTGLVSASGNVTGGNVITGGIVSATGNIRGSNINTDGNVVSAWVTPTTGVSTGGNILVGGYLSVVGNLYVANVVSSQQLVVDDPLVYFTANTPFPYNYAIGFFSDFTGGTGNTYQHTGLVRDYVDNTWKLVSNVPEPVGSTFDFTDAIYDNFKVGQLNINASANATAIVNAGGNGVGNIGGSSTYFNTVFAKATSAQYADLAEKYTADAEYAPGTVVVFGGTHEVTVNAVDGDRKVAGVVSTNPSYIMNSGLEGEFVATVALTGRVPTMVIGPVKKGDMMVAAGLGRARAEADPRVGTVIGKALEDFDGAEGTIEVVVGRF